MAVIPKGELELVKDRKIPGATNQFIDMYLTYQFLKRIILPFEKWPAFKAGIINKEGKVLRTRSSLSRKEKELWGYYDIVVANIKKILAKIPGGKTQIGSIAAAYFLFKEHKKIDCTNERILTEHFLKNWKTLKEEVAANNVGGGNIKFPESTPLGKTVAVDPTAKKRKRSIVKHVNVLRRNRL
jgi:hypothetical protein